MHRIEEQAETGEQLTLLGGFGLTCSGKPIALATSCQRVLALLALHDRALHRSFLAGTLWLEVSEDRAAGNLRSALWRLRQTGHELVEATGSQLRLAPSLTVDLHGANARVHRLLDSPDELEDAELDESPLLSDLLPDWYDDWLLVERERFRELRLRALERLCEQLAAAGRHGRAIECVLAAIEGDPLRESSHRALIKIYLAEGNQAEAIHQYRLYRELLNGRLGFDPSSQMGDLVAGLGSAGNTEAASSGAIV
jgi:DNA-binding SARP family transcriptional activator